MIHISLNHSDQQESLFYFIPAITPPYLVPLHVVQYYKSEIVKLEVFEME